MNTPLGQARAKYRIALDKKGNDPIEDMLYVAELARASREYIAALERELADLESRTRARRGRRW